MATMQVGLQVYTIREHLGTLDGFAGAMRKVREIGYEYVEMAGVGPIEAKEQRRVLDDAGLRAVATHAGYGDLRDRMAEVIERHKVLGCGFAVLPGLPTELHNEAGYRKVAKEMTGFARVLAKAGIRFAYHNHSIEFVRYGGRTGLEILFGESDAKLVGSELDTYWVQHGGGSPAGWIRKLSGRVPMLHLKDFAMVKGEQVFAEVGEGNLDWAGIFEAAAEAGTEWLMVEEDTCGRPCLESVEISFRNLRGMGMC